MESREEVKDYQSSEDSNEEEEIDTTGNGRRGAQSRKEANEGSDEEEDKNADDRLGEDLGDDDSFKILEVKEELKGKHSDPIGNKILYAKAFSQDEDDDEIEREPAMLEKALLDKGGHAKMYLIKTQDGEYKVKENFKKGKF